MHDSVPDGAPSPLMKIQHTACADCLCSAPLVPGSAGGFRARLRPACGNLLPLRPASSPGGFSLRAARRPAQPLRRPGHHRRRSSLPLRRPRSRGRGGACAGVWPAERFRSPLSLWRRASFRRRASLRRPFRLRRRRRGLSAPSRRRVCRLRRRCEPLCGRRGRIAHGRWVRGGRGAAVSVRGGGRDRRGIARGGRAEGAAVHGDEEVID